MLDHVGIPVSDFMRSKGFYLKVLAPLGYGLVLEVASEGLSPFGQALAQFMMVWQR